MKKFMILLFAFGFFAFCNNNIQAQQYDNQEKETPEWVKMMNDPTVNFYEVQKAFNNYFKDRDKGKGTGWKQFKRWEWFMDQRVYPGGERINPAQVWNEMKKFNKQYPPERIAGRNSWTSLGPTEWQDITGHWNPGIGRINVIARHPNDYNTIYIGAPSGGVWKTTDEGDNWTVLTDDLPVIGVSGLAIDPDNPETVYIGTGDRDASDTYSIGVLKSTDGGDNWEETGLNWNVQQFRTVNKILIHPDNTDIVYAATSNGLYRSTDAGDNWDYLLSGDIDDMEFKPGDPNTIYAITQHFFKSTDGGDNFTETTDVPNSSRAQVAVTEANPEYVYFFSSKNGIYRSENSGDSFTKRSDQPNPGRQDWYDLAMAVSHVDPEEVHIAEINTWRSTNGGQTWTKTTEWYWDNGIGYTHCDIHELVFYGNTMYVGSDGLISKTTDGGNNWITFTEGINIRQFYRIGVAKNDPYKILGGSQDNGTSVYSYDHWHEWLGADGMECIVDYTNSDIVYGTSQRGHFYKSNNGGDFGNVNITQPGEGAWITPFVIHPEDPLTLYVGLENVRKSNDGMQSWMTISTLPGGDINAMAISESDPEYLYVSKESDLYRTTNGGDTWVAIDQSLPDLYITYISVHPSDPERLVISFSGYEDGEKVYYSEDAGETWSNISMNLPNIPANCVTFFDDLHNNPIYTGLDVGVYYYDNNLDEWESYMEDLPSVIVNELEVNYQNNKIRAGTYGRGLWEADINTVMPIAEFEADKILIPPECPVNFTNLSSGPPTSFEWHFEGGTPDTSTVRDPQGIIFAETGSFNVRLIVTNNVGADTLIKEDYIVVSDTVLPAPDFVSDRQAICTDGTVQFTDMTDYCPISWEWSFDPNDITYLNGTNANSQNPEVQFVSGDYDVTLTVTNSVGTEEITKEEFIHAGGVSIPFLEDFESGNMESLGWTIENPDHLVTWGIDSVFSKDGHMSAWMNIINYPKFNKRDRMISPVLDFTGYSEVYLTFDHAYALRYFQRDSLIIYISADCGENYTRIWEAGPDGEGSFETSPTTTDPFIPETIEDWCGAGYGAQCFAIPLLDYAGMNNIRLAFESFAVYGNNMYVDNIMVDFTYDIDKNTEMDQHFTVYPNPAEDLFYVINHANVEIDQISVKDIQGKTVFEKYNQNGLLKINAKGFSKGAYLVHIVSGEKTIVKKLMIH